MGMKTRHYLVIIAVSSVFLFLAITALLTMALDNTTINYVDTDIEVNAEISTDTEEVSSYEVETVSLIRSEMLHYNKYITEDLATYRALYIFSTSEKYEVDPLLITAIIVVESGFNQSAISHAGAKGVMQLTPVIEDIYKIDATIFEENVTGGTRFISDLIKQYKGNITLALAHYNGGSNPQYALKYYEETKAYVPKVLALYHDYKGGE